MSYNLSLCELTISNSDYHQTIKPSTRSRGTLIFTHQIPFSSSIIIFLLSFNSREYKFTKKKKKKKKNQQQSDLLPTTPTKRKGSFGRPSLLDSCFRCFKEAFTLWSELTRFIPYHLAFCELTVANSDYYQTIEPPTRSYDNRISFPVRYLLVYLFFIIT